MSPGFLPVVFVCDIRSQSDLAVRLREQIFRPLGVAAELVFVCLLGLFEALVGLNDIALCSRQIAVAAAIDVHDRGLGKHRSDQGRGYAE